MVIRIFHWTQAVLVDGSGSFNIYGLRFVIMSPYSMLLLRARFHDVKISLRAGEHLERTVSLLRDLCIIYIPL